MSAALFRPVPPVRTPGTAAAMIAVASSQVGFREGPDNDNPYGVWYGMNHVAWCAVFQSWAAAHSGNAAAVPKHAYTPSGADWFRRHGRWGTRPRAGALVYLWSQSMGRIHHVALVAKVLDDGSFVTVEGNTNTTGSAVGNGVYKLRRRGFGGGQGGFGYPHYARAVPAPAPRPRPTVHLAALAALAGAAAAGHPPKAASAESLLVQQALVAEGCLPTAAATGILGPETVAAYGKWQATPAGGGYRGKDADGIPGRDSLTRLARRHGFAVRR